MAKCLIAAGGTGGHIFPALAVADCLQRNDIDIHWVGSRGRLEEKLVPPHYPIDYLDIQAVRGRGKLSLLLAPWRISKAIMQAMRLIRRLRPDLILVMGGYVCGPVGIAAWLLRVPVVMHEQNAIAGFTNRHLLRFCNKALQAFPGGFSAKRMDIAVVGNPVRDALWRLPSPSVRIDIAQAYLRVLVVGGSQGARFLNHNVVGMIAQASASIAVQVWHQTGQADEEQVRRTYQQSGIDAKATAFIDDMSQAYSWADLIICRSGALSVSEIAAVGIPAILVPLPSAVDDHQRWNAMVLVKAGGAKLVTQATWSAEQVASWLVEWQSDRMILRRMAAQAQSVAKPDATERVANACELLMKGN